MAGKGFLSADELDQTLHSVEQSIFGRLHREATVSVKDQWCILPVFVQNFNHKNYTAIVWLYRFGRNEKLSVGTLLILCCQFFAANCRSGSVQLAVLITVKLSEESCSPVTVTSAGSGYRIGPSQTEPTRSKAVIQISFRYACKRRQSFLHFALW